MDTGESGMSFMDRVFAAGIVLGLVMILYIAWESHEYRQSIEPECEKRGGVIVETPDGPFACVRIAG